MTENKAGRVGLVAFVRRWFRWILLSAVIMLLPFSNFEISWQRSGGDDLGPKLRLYGYVIRRGAQFSIGTEGSRLSVYGFGKPETTIFRVNFTSTRIEDNG